MLGHNFISVGDRIRIARKALHLTQGELAKQAQISIITLTRYENGLREPTAKSLNKLCEVLRCNSKWLLEGEEEKNATDNDLQKPDSGIYAMDKNLSSNDPTLIEICNLLQNDLPEAKDQILNILLAKKHLKEALINIGA